MSGQRPTEATTHPAETPLRHGYTFNQLHDITLSVIRTDRWRKDIDISDRYDAIRYGITEHLLTVDTAPTRPELKQAGREASDRYVADEMHHHGYDRRNLNAGAGALPSYQRHWQNAGRTPFDERVVEHIALTQVWGELTLAQQQAVMALALTADYQEAAESLGLRWPAFAGRMHKARRRVHALWHQHETPRKQARDKRVFNRTPVDGRGRRRLTEADLDNIRGRKATGSTLQTLANEYGYTAGGLSNLLNGKKKPAPAQGEMPNA